MRSWRSSPPLTSIGTCRFGGCVGNRGSLTSTKKPLSSEVRGWARFSEGEKRLVNRSIQKSWNTHSNSSCRRRSRHTTTRALERPARPSADMTSVATQASCPIVIKIPVSSKSRVAAPPVAARLQARRFPARDGTAPEVRFAMGRRDARAPSSPHVSANDRISSESCKYVMLRALERGVRPRARVARARCPRTSGAQRALTVADIPSRTTQKTARKELLAASALARKSAIAAAHNARVTDVHDTATLMQTQIMEYHRSTIDRRLQARLPPGSRNLAFFSPSLAPGVDRR